MSINPASFRQFYGSIAKLWPKSDFDLLISAKIRLQLYQHIFLYSQNTILFSGHRDPEYIYIYIYMYIVQKDSLHYILWNLVFKFAIFAIRPWRAISSPNPGIHSYRNAPTDRGIILHFRWKMRLTLFLPVRIHRFKVPLIFQLLVYLRRSIIIKATY